MARERYIVTKIDGDWLTIQKLLRDRFCSKQYRIHISECFTIPSNRFPNNNNLMMSSEDEDDSEDHDQPFAASSVQHNIDTCAPAVSDNSSVTVPVIPEEATPAAARRYPSRNRRPPSLLLNEIAPNFFEGEVEAGEGEEEVATP